MFSLFYVDQKVINDLQYQSETIEDEHRVKSMRMKAFWNGMGIMRDANIENEFVDLKIFKHLSQKDMKQLNQSRDSLRKEVSSTSNLLSSFLECRHFLEFVVIKN